MSTYVGKFLDPGQAEDIIRLEKHRRRTARLNQVRQLAHHNAAKVCNAVRKERTRQSLLLSQQLECEWRRSKQEMLEVVGQEYFQCLQGVGLAHKETEIEKTFLAKQSGQSIRDRLAALDRGRAALDAVRTERISSEKQLEEDQQHRKHIRLVENERASLMASLPPPAVTISPSPTPSPSRPLIIEEKYGNSPAKSKCFGPKDPLASVNVQVIAGHDINGADARRNALAEEQRMSELTMQVAAEREDRAKREHQRFLKAKSQMEHERDYNLVLLELEKLDKYDWQYRKKEQVCLKTDGEAFEHEKTSAKVLHQMGILPYCDNSSKFVEPVSVVETGSSVVTDSTSTVQTSSEEPPTPLVHLVIRPPVDISDKSKPHSPLSSTVSATTEGVTTGSSASLSGSGWSSSGSELEPPTVSSSSIPFSAISLDDGDPSDVIIAGLLHGDRSQDVTTVGSPTQSMLQSLLAKTNEKQLPGDGWSDDELDGDLSDDEMTIGRIQYDDIDQKPKKPVSFQASAVVLQVGSANSSSLSDQDKPEPVLQQVTLWRPSMDRGRDKVVDSRPAMPSAVGSPVFKNVEVVQTRLKTNISEAEANDGRARLLRHLLSNASRLKNMLPPKDRASLQLSDDFFVKRSKTTDHGMTRLHPAGLGTVTDLSTIIEVDTPEVSRMTADHRRVSGVGRANQLSPHGQEQLDVSMASTAHRFEHLFDKNEQGINDEPNLTFASTVPSAQSLNNSLVAAVTQEEATDPFGNSSSVGSWWQESYQRKVDAVPQHFTPSGISEPSGTISCGLGETAVTPASMATGTPSCPLSIMSTDLGDTTFGGRSLPSVGSLTLPSSSSSSSRIAMLDRLQRPYFSADLVETVETPTLSTSGSGAWSECLIGTPAAISPPSDTDSETPTAVTVMPRVEPSSPAGHLLQPPTAGLASDDGSYHGHFRHDSRLTTCSEVGCQFPEVSFTDSNQSFLSNERLAGTLPDVSGFDSSIIRSNLRDTTGNGSESDNRRRSRSLFRSTGSSGSNTASESLLSFLLHEMSAVSGMSALTPLELSLSSSSHTTTS